MMLLHSSRRQESTCKVHGLQEHTCLVCEYKEETAAPLAEHSFGDWSIYKEPTLEEEGIERNYCTVCGAYEDLQPEANFYYAINMLTLFMKMIKYILMTVTPLPSLLTKSLVIKKELL